MDTLRKIRPSENIKEFADRRIDDKNDIPYLLIAIKQRNGNIVIVKDHSDEIVKTAFEEIDPDASGQVFFASELNVDPLNNVMVPRHRLATDEEIEYLVNRRIRKRDLPVLLMTDPIRRWHDFPKNSIVAIDRPNGKYFRIVT